MQDKRKWFIPYRCELCAYGQYNHMDSCWENGCHASDDSECMKLFENKYEQKGTSS